MLTVPGVSYSTNDDLAIARVGSALLGLGWPRSVGIRADSATQLRDQVGVRLDDVARAHPITAPQITSGEHPAQARTYYRPDEIARATGTAIAPEHRLSLVVLPAFSDRVALDVLEPSDVADALRPHAQLHPDAKQAPFARELMPVHDPRERDHTLAALAEQVACARLAWRFDDLRTGRDRVAELARQLAGTDNRSDRPPST
jgi:hypothetical protein